MTLHEALVSFFDNRTGPCIQGQPGGYTDAVQFLLTVAPHFPRLLSVHVPGEDQTPKHWVFSYGG